MEQQVKKFQHYSNEYQKIKELFDSNWRKSKASLVKNVFKIGSNGDNFLPHHLNAFCY
jgi:hypothetical protein